jgi:hypothetical protein
MWSQNFLETAVATEVLRRPVESIRVRIKRAASSTGFGARLSKVAADSGRSSLALLREIAILRFGAGSLSFDEYVGLRLFDKNIFADADKKAFVGLKASQKIWLQANYRLDLFALVHNKLASDVIFATHGFPILPTFAIFHERVGRPCEFLLGSDVELRAFLTKNDHYPLFGKPINGYQSVGSESIDRYDQAHDRLVTTTGREISLDTFISFVKTHSASGYLFQRRVSPHAAVREICGDRLATVRLLTIVTKGETKLLRACWKIPAGTNTADNFWRPGNLLAQLDHESGCVLRVLRRNGTNYEEITNHPDTGTRILGTVVPNWQEVTLLALEGAKLFEEIPLVGWDIAPVDSGAVMVEPNSTPDFNLHQLADRRGILDATFRSFLAERKKQYADALRTAKQTLR